MKRFLIVVDMQKDFVDGALGTKEAMEIVPCAVKKIQNFCGYIFVTYDTHFENYSNTLEGKHLPVPHCIKGTEGHRLNRDISKALEGRKYTEIEKSTFGLAELPEIIRKAAGNEEFSVELIGLCTDICVVSNALLLKASFPETEITVDSACCAGVTPESHQAALTVMKMCQINVI